MSPELQDLHDRALALIERARKAAAGLTDDEYNRIPASGEWSIAGIFQHLKLSHRPYFPAIEDALKRARSAPGETTVRLSTLGKMIHKMAGPGGNAPAPKALIPGDGPWPRVLVDDFCADQRRLANLIQLANGLDINGTSLSNPFFRLMKMRVSDALAITVAHGERHILQIEGRVASVSSDTATAR